MINERFVVAAREIRKEYFSLSQELDEKKDKLKGFAEFLLEKGNEFIKIKDNKKSEIKTQEQLLKFAQDVLKQMNEIEEREKQMNKEVQEISDKLDKLKEEEIELLKKIKEKYPLLSNEKIKYEIHSRL